MFSGSTLLLLRWYSNGICPVRSPITVLISLRGKCSRFLCKFVAVLNINLCLLKVLPYEFGHQIFVRLNNMVLIPLNDKLVDDHVDPMASHSLLTTVNTRSPLTQMILSIEPLPPNRPCPVINPTTIIKSFWRSCSRFLFKFGGVLNGNLHLSKALPNFWQKWFWFC